MRWRGTTQTVREAEQETEADRETQGYTQMLAGSVTEDKKRRERIDPGKSKRLIDIVKKVSRRVKTRGS